MIFNYTNDNKFTARLKINGQSLEVIKNTRILGTIISDDLKLDLNCKDLVKKADGRMQLLRKNASFGASIEDLKTIYILNVRSVLEQSFIVWIKKTGLKINLSLHCILEKWICKL